MAKKKVSRYAARAARLSEQRRYDTLLRMERLQKRFQRGGSVGECSPPEPVTFTNKRGTKMTRCMTKCLPGPKFRIMRFVSGSECNLPSAPSRSRSRAKYAGLDAQCRKAWGPQSRWRKAYTTKSGKQVAGSCTHKGG